MAKTKAFQVSHWCSGGTARGAVALAHDVGLGGRGLLGEGVTMAHAVAGLGIDAILSRTNERGGICGLAEFINFFYFLNYFE